MKRALPALLLLLLLSMPLRAQDKGGLMIGPTAGMSISTVTFRPTIAQSPYLGYSGGIALRYDVESYAGILLEVQYSQRGWIEAPEDYPDYLYKRHLTFIHVPLMSHFMIGESTNPLKVTIDAGSHFGYKIAEREEEHLGDFEDASEMQGVYTAHHGTPIEHNFWWGVGGDVGVEYHLEHLVIGIRGGYLYNLGELFDNSRTSLFGTSSEQVIEVRASVLYRF